MRPGIGPIYRSGKGQYGIDTCEPQLRAIAEGKIQFHALSKGNYPGKPMKPSMLPGVASIGFWDAVGPQDWGLQAHRNEGLEIGFLETGGMAFVVDRKQFDLRPGTVTITRPWQVHKLGAPNIGQGRLHWVILDVGVRRPNQEWCWPDWVSLTHRDRLELTRKLRLSERPVWTATGDVAQVFRGLARCILNWDRPHSVSRLTTQLNQLLLGILDLLTEQPMEEQPHLTSRRHTVELFLRDLAENPTSSRETWTLDQMARQCGMGVTAFSKYCHELVNSGGVEYLNHCRLERAARQLRTQPERPVTQIAFENGFNSSQYFATAFKSRFHTTPRAYREAVPPAHQTAAGQAKAPGLPSSMSPPRQRA